MEEVPALILAGGQNIRFQPYAAVIPKGLAPIAGKPAVRYTVESLVRQHFDVNVVVNRKDIELFRHEFRDMPGVVFLSEDEEQVKQNTSDLVGSFARFRPEVSGLLLVYGDDFTFHKKSYFTDIVAQHQSEGNSITIGVAHPFSSYGQVELKGTSVIGFSEKPLSTGYVWTGVAVIKRHAFDLFTSGVDIGTFVLPSALHLNHAVGAFILPEQWLDIGDVGRYFKVKEAYEK